MDPQDQEPGGVLERRRSPIGLIDAVAFERHPLRTLARRRRGGEQLFELTSIVGGRTHVIATPDLAHEVLHAPPGTYRAGAANRRILPLLPENTLLTLDGAAHRQRRQLLAPMLRGDALDAIAPVIGELAAQETVGWPVGRPVALLPRTRRLALRIAAQVLLGVEDPICVEQLDRHLRAALRPYSMLSGKDSLARLGRLSPQAAGERGRRAFARGLEKVMGCQRPREATGAGDGVAAKSAHAGLSPDEIFALLLAAYETTATALTWTITLLSHSPRAADDVVRELSGTDRPWLDAVIWEALRLRPPLVDIVRQPAQTVRLARREIPAGTLLLIPPPLIHRHSDLQAPDGFAPERFMSRRPDPRTWLPFGGGDRRCLGASLATLVLRQSLPQILGRFAVVPDRPTAERSILYGTALVPARGGRVVLYRREGQAGCA